MTTLVCISSDIHFIPEFGMFSHIAFAIGTRWLAKHKSTKNKTVTRAHEIKFCAIDDNEGVWNTKVGFSLPDRWELSETETRERERRSLGILKTMFIVWRMLSNLMWTKFQINRNEWLSSPSLSHPNSFFFP
jgi:hypothetical protein